MFVSFSMILQMVLSYHHCFEYQAINTGHAPLDLAAASMQPSIYALVTAEDALVSGTFTISEDQRVFSCDCRWVVGAAHLRVTN